MFYKQERQCLRRNYRLFKFKRGKIRSRIPLGRRLMAKKALEIDFCCTPR